MSLAPDRLSRRAFLRDTALAATAATLAVPRFAGVAEARPVAPAVPGGSPPSPPGLDAFITDRMHRARVPAVAAAVVADGEVRWARGYGWANTRRSVRATTTTPFMLASVSKTVMSVALMQVVEAGGLALDDDISDHLPFPVRNPHAPDVPITARMLLTHTSSIRDNWKVLIASYVRGDSKIPLGSFLQDYLTRGGRYFDPRLNFAGTPPSTEYRYCNIGAALAGFLVESVTGVPFDRHCDERIFGPLGMTATGWHLADLNRAAVAMPYRFDGPNDAYQPYGQYGYPDYPDGELRTGAAHLARFLGAFIGFGAWRGTRILLASTVEEMRRRQYQRIVRGQGLIWYYDHRGGDILLGHNGGDSGVSTRMFFRPSDGIGVIVLANGDADSRQRDGGLQDIQDRLFAVFGTRPFGAVRSEPAAPTSGRPLARAVPRAGFAPA